MRAIFCKAEVNMSTKDAPLFEAFLNRHESGEWAEIIRSLLSHIHEVDRTATRIWFAFFPLEIARAFDQAPDPEDLARRLVMQGRYLLKDHIDTSHTFLYGHRYWPEVKQLLIERAISARAPASLDLALLIREFAGEIAGKVKAEQSLLTGITAVAFMTLQQTGLDAFKFSPGKVLLSGRRASKSPDQILKERARDDGQGLFGFLKGEEKVYTITFDENDASAAFKLINTQHLTTAAANDKRDFVSRDSRCTVDEGPIPVQCRSASCGTCWVGVLGGAEKLSSVAPLESRRIKEFGYIDTDEPKPIIRLACQAQAHGAVSIVIPPWNGVYGKFLRGYKSLLDETQELSK